MLHVMSQVVLRLHSLLACCLARLEYWTSWAAHGARLHEMHDPVPDSNAPDGLTQGATACLYQVKVGLCI